MANFGLNQRQLTKDVNEGKVQPPLEEGIVPKANVHAQGKQQTIGRGGNASGQLAELFMDVASKAADLKLKQQNKTDQLDGVILAGKVDGLAQAKADEPLLNEIFGIPSVKLRTVQEEIATNSSSTLALKLDEEMKVDGYVQTPNDWRMHIDEQVRKMLEPHKGDADMTRKVTASIAPRVQKNIASHYRAHNQYNVQAKKNSDIQGLLLEAKVAKEEYASNDTGRTKNALNGLRTKMKDLAMYAPDQRATLILDAIGNETTADGNTIVETAQEFGYLDNLTIDQQNRIDSYYLVHAQRNEKAARLAGANLTEAAQKGDIRSTLKQFNAVNAQWPGMVNKNAVVEKAIYNNETNRLQTDAIDTVAARYSVGDPDIRKTKNKRELKQRNGMEEGAILMKGIQKHYDEEIDHELRKTRDEDDTTPISRAERQEFLNKHLLMFADKWSKGNIKVPMVSNAINALQSELRNPNIDEGGLRNLNDKLAQFGKTREANGYLMSQQYRDPAQAAFMEDMYQRVYVEGGNPASIIAETLASEQRLRQFGEPPSLPPEEIPMDDMLATFRADQGENVLSRWFTDVDSQADLEAQLMSNFNEEYARYGDLKTAQYAAVNRTNTSGKVINGAFNFQGVELDKRMNGDAEGTLKRIFGNERVRQELVRLYNFDSGTTGEEGSSADSNFWSKDTVGMDIFPDPRSNDVFVQQRFSNGDRSGVVRLSNLETLIAPEPERDMVEGLNTFSKRTLNFADGLVNGWNRGPLQNMSSGKVDRSNAIE